jgi:hypothetical protein
MILNETSFSEDIECPYCGYEGAGLDSETRHNFSIEYKGLKISGYDEEQSCPLCGWVKYIAHEYEYVIDSVEEELQKIVDPNKIEDWDSYLNKYLPDEEFEDKPNKEVVKLAKKIIKEIYNKVKDDDKVSVLFTEVTLDMPAIKIKQQKKDLLEFRENMIKKVFGNFRN